jgi:Uma2 family endonuclease
MSTDKPRQLLRIEYEKAAEAYKSSLPPEHYMEATRQATQRKITLESLDLVHARRPEVQLFNELLIQYPYGRRRQIRQVVPDNFVAIHPEPLQADTSYDLPLQPVGPFWVLEYVSKRSERKDYEDSFRKYERELKVPYYLIFYPDNQELTLFRHRGGKYSSVRANAAGRYPLRELGLEVALLEGWVRFWYAGELLLLPAALQLDREEARQEAREARQEARHAQEEARHAREDAERERQHKERLLARLRELGIEPPD